VTFVLIPLVAFLAGLTNAIAGGGTFFMFPALTGLAGLTEKVANMTSTIGLWPGSASSVVAARPEFKRLPKGMAIAFVIISLIGAGVGSVLLLVTSQRTFTLLVPWLLLFATVIFAFSKPIARWAGRHHGKRSLKWTIFVAAIQLIVAIYGGYFGAGIGILMLAGLAFAGMEDIHQMNALKVILQTAINAVASIIFIFSPLVWEQWRFVIPMAVMSAVGGFIGIAVARKAPQTTLRLIIIAIGMLLTLAYFVKVYGGRAA
jgi:uncharacterized membrane protein YfcA